MCCKMIATVSKQRFLCFSGLQESFWNWIQITDCFLDERINIFMIRLLQDYYSYSTHVFSTHAHNNSDDRLNPVWTGQGALAGLRRRFAAQQNRGINWPDSLLFVSLHHNSIQNSLLLRVYEILCGILRKGEGRSGTLCRLICDLRGCVVLYAKFALSL